MKKKQPVKLQEYVYSEDEDFFTISTSQRTLAAREISRLFYLGRLCGYKQV
jgi:hypothetical protein